MSRDLPLFTNHGAVLLALARRPDLRIREIAGVVGVTERATQGILNDLVTSGYLERRRDGRRNRYLVRGDVQLQGFGNHEVGDLVRALVGGSSAPPATGGRRAVVLACSDFRYQEPLRDLLAAEGLLARSEVFLWPGGSAVLGGPDHGRILDAMIRAVGAESRTRLVLVAHQGCHARGARVAPRRDLLDTGRAVLHRRRRGIEVARRTFGVEPELWFLTERGARRVHFPRSSATTTTQRRIE